jgi:poly(beta-D-mannuronate) lyase
MRRRHLIGIINLVFFVCLFMLLHVQPSLVAAEQSDSDRGVFEGTIPLMVNQNQGEPGERLVRTPEELELAIATAVPGDVIMMQDGIWKDIDIIFKAIGTEGKPITLRAQTQGKVIISGSSSLRISGQYLVVDGLHFKDGSSSRSLHLIEFRDGQDNAYHSRLTNIVISEFNKDRARVDASDTWVGLFGSHNRVDHSFFHGKTSVGRVIIVWRPTPETNHHRIDHNYFKDIPSDGGNGTIAIRIGDGTQGLTSSATIVEHNLFENMQGIGKIINIKSSGNTIRNNTFVRASGSIMVRHGNGNLIEGNVILPGLEDKYTGGITLIGEDHIVRNNYIQGTRSSGKAAIALIEGDANNYPGKGSYYPSKNVVIENNTLVDNDKNMIIGQLYDPKTELTVPVENVTFRENAVLGNGNMTPMVMVLDEPDGVTYANNQFYNGSFHGIKDIPGIDFRQPSLQLGENGMYGYTKDNTLKENKITTPLLRTEVGPDWVKSRWAEFGIEDKPYMDLPVKNLIQKTANETARPVEAALSSGGSVAEAAEQTENNGSSNRSFLYTSFGIVVIMVAAASALAVLKRRKRTQS